MFFVNKKILFSLTIALLTTFHINAETVTSHISYVSAWTGAGIGDGLNKELSQVLEKARSEGKIFELVDIAITPEYGYAYILYNLVDEGGPANFFDMQVAYVSAWTGAGMAANLQDQIGSLQKSALEENKFIDILGIRLTPEWGYGYIIYEVSK